MIKLIMWLTRHSDMSREQFLDCRQNSHNPFFMSNADIMGAHKTVQPQTPGSALLEDEANLIDRSRCRAFIAREHELRQTHP